MGGDLGRKRGVNKFEKITYDIISESRQQIVTVSNALTERTRLPKPPLSESHGIMSKM